MKFRIISIVIILYLGLQNIYSQSTRVTETTSIAASINYSVLQYTEGSSSAVYSSDSGYNIGYYIDSVLVTETKTDGTTYSYYKKCKYIYIAVYALAFGNFGDNITVNSVTVHYTNSISDGYTFKLTRVSSEPSTSAGAWSSAGSSTTIAGGNAYGIYLEIPSNSSLISAVQSGMTNRSTIYIGGVSEFESTSGSRSSLNLVFEINYTRDRNKNINTVQNYMDGNNGGTISINSVAKASPATDTLWEGNSNIYAAIDNQSCSYNSVDYNYVYNDGEGIYNTSYWKKGNVVITSSTSYAQTIAYATNNSATYTAYLIRVCNVALVNQFTSSLAGGYMLANLTQADALLNTMSSQSMPLTAGVVYTNGITVYAPGQDIGNSLYATFEKWSDGNTTATRSITPTAHQAVTAYYKLKSTSSYRSLSFNSTIGDPITLTWNEHSSANVGSYKIFRRFYGETTATQIATVSKGTGSTNSYIDTECVITANTGPNSRIFYDVRAVYSGALPDGTTYTTDADEYFEMQFGAANTGVDANIVSGYNSSNAAISAVSSIPTEYKLSNYPNPFNPTTVIQYTMPEAGQVVLKVYNMIGQEVKTLVDRMESAGVHSVNFNANGLPTGIYIARIQAGTKVMSLKLQLVK